MCSRKTIFSIFICSLFGLTMCVEVRAIELEERFEQLEAQQRSETEALQSQVARLIDRIDSEDRNTRRRAVAELVFYADDPRVIERLLSMLAAEGGSALSTEGRINVMYVLLQTTPQAWTAPLLESADSILEMIAERHLPLAGPQQRRYIEDLTEHVHDIEVFSTPSVEFGVVQERTAETAALTDIDVFVCSGIENLEPAYELATLLADRDFGRVRLRELTPSMGFDLAGIEGSTTVFFDANHPEEKEVARVESAVQEIGSLPPFESEPNQDSSSYWYLSVIVCP